MATETEKTTRELVEELYDDGMTEAGDIAEALSKTPATVYVHLRKIREERGEKPRGRGRPPKAKTEGEEKAKPKPAPKAKGKTTRPAPTRKAPQAKTETKTEAKAEAKSEAKTNGHVSHAERFPLVADAIEKQLAGKRREVEVLENMLAGISK